MQSFVSSRLSNKRKQKKEPTFVSICPPFFDSLYSFSSDSFFFNFVFLSSLFHSNLGFSVLSNLGCIILDYRIKDPNKAVLNVEDYDQATKLLAQTTLRSVIGGTQLVDVLIKREEISSVMRDLMDTATDPWGIHIDRVEVRDIVLPDNMQRAMVKKKKKKKKSKIYKKMCEQMLMMIRMSFAKEILICLCSLSLSLSVFHFFCFFSF